jgi:hypothetical protein
MQWHKHQCKCVNCEHEWPGIVPDRREADLECPSCHTDGGKVVRYRPDWCPYADCEFLLQFQNMMCVGRLPKPEPHLEGLNTHRFCLDERETEDGVHDLQLNRGDAWLMKRLLDQVKE